MAFDSELKMAVEAGEASEELLALLGPAEAVVKAELHASAARASL
jgi:hypothetical protein